MALFKKEIVIKSPVDGKIKALSKVKDQMFKDELMGKGVAVVPKATAKPQEVFSPVDGKLVNVFKTGHAYTVKHKKGPSVLVHIGLDTVKLKGKGFDVKVAQDDAAETTTKLADVDFKFIKTKKKLTDVIVIALNEGIGKYEVTDIAEGPIKAGEPLFKLKKVKKQKEEKSEK